MVERSRSGAYIPVGKIYRSQLEATSPWSFAEKAKRLHAEDVCPDCAAEQSLKKRESAKVREGILEAASHFHGAPPPAHASSQVPAATSGPGQTNSSDAIKDTGPIVVVQHEGVLDRLAIDPRRGPLTRASTQRLSENLVKVSEAVARLGSVDEHPVQTNSDTSHSQVDRPEPQPLRPIKIKSCSMSELLEDLYVIAAGMNVDLSEPTKGDTFTPPSDDTDPTRPYFDAEGLLSEPTSSAVVPGNITTPKIDQDLPRYTRGLTPGQFLLHDEDPESLLSEPTSPGPINDIASSEAKTLRGHTQTSINTLKSPPSAYVTAVPTRNNSIQGPVPLPSSILRAKDYSPVAAAPVIQRPASQQKPSPRPLTASRFAPGHFPLTPSPRSISNLKQAKAVEPPKTQSSEHEKSPPSEPSNDDAEQTYIEMELQKAVEEVEARERDLHRAVWQAAEMERSLSRRRTRTRGDLSGAYKGQQ